MQLHTFLWLGGDIKAGLAALRCSLLRTKCVTDLLHWTLDEKVWQRFKAAWHVPASRHAIAVGWQHMSATLIATECYCVAADGTHQRAQMVVDSCGQEIGRQTTSESATALLTSTMIK